MPECSLEDVFFFESLVANLWAELTAHDTWRVKQYAHFQHDWN
jgi:hypothetical protein